jgi:hypothetical protein
MATVLDRYIHSVEANLRLERSVRREVIRELQSHIDDEVRDLKAKGLSEDEAARTCLSFLGSARLVARQIYEAHSQGSWSQALLASAPHIMFGLLFALNMWRGVGGVLIFLVLILSIAVYGWWRGRPAWLFPWLGYCLPPVVAGGLLLLYLPPGWSWAAILVYLPLALWLLYSVTVQSIRQDWLYTSLMLLPLPILIGWVLIVEPVSGASGDWLQRIEYFAPWIGVTCLSLGLAVVTFIRLRKRWLRLSVLIFSGLLTLIMAAYYAEGRLSLQAFMVLAVGMLLLLLSPAVMDRTLHRGQPPAAPGEK